jgi:hypothetical protein
MVGADLFVALQRAGNAIAGFMADDNAADLQCVAEFLRHSATTLLDRLLRIH